LAILNNVLDATQSVPSMMATNVTISSIITSRIALPNDDVDDLGSEAPICVICHVSLNGNPAGVEALMCGHTFHSQRIRSWWHMKHSSPKQCAICKQQPFAEEDDDEHVVLVVAPTIQGILRLHHLICATVSASPNVK